MWHSSRGDRTLRNAEALLVAAAIETMMDALMVHIDDDDVSIPECESGISVFDRLNACQRIGVLRQVARYLLADTPKPLKLSANSDAAVAAIFVEVRDQIAIEVDLCDELDAPDGFRWRTLVYEAARDLDLEDDDAASALKVTSDDLEQWEDAVDLLANGVLWDRDFEMVDGFLDADPGTSQQRLRLLGIDRDYFTEIPPDPTADQAYAMIRETRQLLRAKPR